MAAGVRFRPAADAEETLMRLASPALETAARALAAAIPGQVPVHHGVVVRTYQPTVTRRDFKRVDVAPGSPFWHWIEYGTRWNAPYRPIQRAAESVGLDYTAK